jgi:hypothetical protein
MDRAPRTIARADGKRRDDKQEQSETAHGDSIQDEGAAIILPF